MCIRDREEIKAEAEIGKKLISNYETQFILSDPPNYEPTREDSIAYIAEQRNQSEEEVIYDELIKDNGKSLIYACFTSYENHKLEFVETFYKLKSSVAGGSDGGAHCGLICDASMPTTNLSHWARDRSAGNKIPLELIIRKQTKDTAETYGLFDRGEIKTGMIADINIIDFEKIFVVPSGNPVFKDSHFIDSEKRIEVLNIAFKDIENVYIDNRETLKKGVSFPFIDEKKWKKN